MRSPRIVALPLGEIYAQALHAAGYKIKRQLNLGSEQIALKTLQAERVDAYRYGVWVLCGDGKLAEGSIWDALSKARRFLLSRPSVTETPGSGEPRELLAAVDIGATGIAAERALGDDLT
jgi:hypothetical protein